MGRLLRPVDIAATVGHLLSDASAMMTGTIIDLHPEKASCRSVDQTPEDTGLCPHPFRWLIWFQRAD